MDEIFIIDESPVVRELLRLPIKKLGVEPLLFDSKAACLAALEKSLPLLALVDFGSGILNGCDVCRAIKSSKKSADVPVVLISPEGATDKIMQGWVAGADDFLPKPVRVAQLEPKIAAVKKLASASPAQRVPPLERNAILFVEDDQFFRTLLGGALENMGFHLAYVSSGEEALFRLQELNGVAAVIADFVLPGMDGLALATRLRLAPGGANTPFFLVTSTDRTPEIEQRVRALPGTVLLSKKNLPVEALVRSVNIALCRVPTELRVTERVTYYTLVEFRTPGDEWLTGFTYDISAGGLFVRSLTPLTAGSEIEVRIRLPGLAAPATSGGTVAWSNSFGRRKIFSYPMGMGVALSRLTPELKSALEAVVQARPVP